MKVDDKVGVELGASDYLGRFISVITLNVV